MEPAYLVRYGLMRRVGRFAADTEKYERGEVVVVRSSRGLELGEVLVRAPSGGETELSSTANRVLRAAGLDDLERARQLELERPQRLAACERLFQDGIWPLQLIDVEPLLDDRKTVLLYLGPHRLDVAGLREVFRATCGLDLMLEPAGVDAPLEDEQERGTGCGSCGTGGSCSSGGGCSSGSHSRNGGCSGCAVKDLLSRARH